MKLGVLKEARAEIVSTAKWYDDQRRRLGDEFITAVEAAILECQAHPLSCSFAEGFDGPYDVRRFLVRKFPYQVIFRLGSDQVTVIAVSHVQREPLYWSDRL